MVEGLTRKRASNFRDAFNLNFVIENVNKNILGF